MYFGIFVKAAREATQIPAFNQSRQGLVDRSTPRHVEEVGGREDTAAPSSAGSAHDPVGN